MINESKLTKKTRYFQCPHNNTGYCKFRDHCIYQHFYNICSNTLCKNYECQNRHPKTCRFGESCKFKSKNSCAYKHDDKIESNNKGKHLNAQHISFAKDDAIQKENQYLKKKVRDLEKVLSEEIHSVKVLRTEVDTLKEDLRAKTIMIDDLEKQCREANSIMNDFEKTESGMRKEIIQCSVCNSTIDLEDTLGEHMLKYHGVECQKCYKTFKSEPKLKFHIRFDHTENEKAVACKKCKFLFQIHEEYEKHLSGLQHNEEKNIINSEESDDEDDEYLDACNLCGIILHSYEELDDHQSNYLRCENCSVCFHNEFQWSKHENCDN